MNLLKSNIWNKKLYVFIFLQIMLVFCWPQVPSVSAIAVVPDIHLGTEHTVQMKADGTVWDWGRNDQGQLGDGTTTDRRVPVASGISNAIATAAGDLHTLALKADGTVWAITQPITTVPPCKYRV